MKSVDWKQSGIWRWAACGDTEDTELQWTLMNCMRSSMAFALTYLPSAFKKPMTADRVAHFRLLDDDTIPFGYVIAYRGFMKTTSMWAKMVQNTCYRKEKYTMPISLSDDYAIRNSEAVRTELMTNERIIEHFGDMSPQRVGGLLTSFSRESWYASDWRTGMPFAYFNPRGAGQQISGAWVTINGDTVRPSFIPVDDAENRLTIRSTDQRKNFIEWAEGALFPCVSDDMPNPETHRWDAPADDPTWRPPYRFLWQDTQKHVDAYIKRITRDKRWIGHIFPKAKKDPDGVWHSTAPELFTHEQVRAEVKHHEQAGTIRIYSLEYLCTGDVQNAGGWESTMFHYYHDPMSPSDLPNNNLTNDPNVVKFVVADPAQTDNERSCDSACGAVGIDKANTRIYFRTSYKDRIPVEEFAKKAMQLTIATNSRRLYVEVTGAKGSLLYVFRTVQKENGWTREFQIVPIDAKKDTPVGDFGTGPETAKRARGSQLLPFYRRNEVWHDESLMGGSLETSELTYPEPDEWDEFDCFAHVPYIMEKYEGISWKHNPVQNLTPQNQFYMPDNRTIFQKQIDAAKSNEWRMFSLV